MAFWSKKQHNLPKFPAEVIPLFTQLSVVLEGEELERFRSEVDEILKEEGAAAIQRAPESQRILFELIEISKLLLEQYERRSAAEKRLIIGGIRYFVGKDDPVPDDSFKTGLHDDARVMNHVLEELGITGHFIDLRV